MVFSKLSLLVGLVVVKEGIYMAKTGRYKVQFRRRHDGKTDYRQRRKIVFSRRNRVVIRKSNKNIRLQFISSHPSGDQTHVYASSYELEKSFQWKGSGNSIPAAYLTGYLFGKRLIAKKLAGDEVILDMGLARKFYGSRIFSALKGVIDSGVDIAHSTDVPIFPTDERIHGEHIATYAKDLAKEDNEKYNHIFNQYLKKGFKPENIPEECEKIKNTIDKTVK